MAGKIKGRQVKLSDHTDLELFLRTSDSVSISNFGYDGNPDTLKQSIKDGIQEISSTGGSIYIPPTNELKSSFHINYRYDKLEELKDTVEYFYHRYPIKNEKRPYLHEEFKQGDKVYSNEPLNEFRCMGWICVEGGIDSKWQGFGYISPTQTYVEKMDQLPKPSEMQEGRLVRLTDSNKETLCICLFNGKEYVWLRMDKFMGAEDEVPSSHYDGVWCYNSDQGVYKYYSKMLGRWVSMPIKEKLGKGLFYDSEDKINLNISEFELSHNSLLGNSEVDLHPIKSIKGLVDELKNLWEEITSIEKFVNYIFTSDLSQMRKELSKLNDDIKDIKKIIDKINGSNSSS